ncbi:hypothetical protein C6495_11475 [Candidatus Poribacteria bacterium]|nr:MAG: hypothetical protein C6495_11475 [Candidatus Poribacteria bacterium]
MINCEHFGDFSQKKFDIYCIFEYNECKRGEMRAKKRATARLKSANLLNEERHREPANCLCHC